MPTQLIPKANLLEIFSSIQGEGVLVGCRQIFLRFPDCNLNCRYCDTDFLQSKTCQIENSPGTGNLDKVSNPLDFGTVESLISAWDSRIARMRTIQSVLPGGNHWSISSCSLRGYLN